MMKVCLLCISFFFQFSAAWLEVPVAFKQLPWSLPKITRRDKKNFKLSIALGILGVELSAQVYTHMPQSVIYGSEPVPIVSRKHNQDSVVIIFPGAGGPDAATEKLRRRITTSDKLKNIQRLVSVYNWDNWKRDFVRISYDSEAVGKTVCSALAEEERTKGPIHHLHVIGISVGSFAADSCVTEYKKTSSNPGYTRVTFLDPFTSQGLFDYWGQRNFGKKADLAVDYLNRDDVVPTTNEPLYAAFNIDVTKAASKKDFVPQEGESYHSWPVEYLTQVWETKVDPQGQIVDPSAQTFPRGQIIEAN